MPAHEAGPGTLYFPGDRRARRRLLRPGLGSHGLGARRAARDPARHPRHHPGRCRPAGVHGGGDADARRPGRPRSAVLAGLLHRSHDASRPCLHAHRPLSRGARHPRERPAPGRRPRRAGEPSPGGRVRHRRLRLRLPARPPVRPRPRLRPLRRRSGRGSGGAPRGRDDRSRARPPPRQSCGARRCWQAPLPLGPLLRPARALRAARAVPLALRGEPLPWGGRLHGPRARAPGRWVRGALPESRRPDPGRGGPRGGLGRPRRGPARQPPLPGGHAGAARHRRDRHSGRRARRAGEHPAGLRHRPRLGRRRGAPGAPRRRAGGGAGRGDEALPAVRLAAAGHGRRHERRRAAQADPLGGDRGLRPARRSARVAEPGRPAPRPPRRSRTGDGARGPRLPDPRSRYPGGRRAVRRAARRARTSSASRASATSPGKGPCRSARMPRAPRT